jgi:hypothetical protein
MRDNASKAGNRTTNLGESNLDFDDAGSEVNGLEDMEGSKDDECSDSSKDSEDDEVPGASDAELSADEDNDKQVDDGYDSL